MQKTFKTNNQEISIKVYGNRRMVTFADIDLVHNRPRGTAKRNFERNKKRLIQSVDYHVLSRDQIRTDTNIELEPHIPFLTLISETGYLMIVKSLTDDSVWLVQRQLINGYFGSTNFRLPQLPTPAPVIQGVPKAPLCDLLIRLEVAQAQSEVLWEAMAEGIRGVDDVYVHASLAVAESLELLHTTLSGLIEYRHAPVYTE